MQKHDGWCVLLSSYLSDQGETIGCREPAQEQTRHSSALTRERGYAKAKPDWRCWVDFRLSAPALGWDRRVAGWLALARDALRPMGSLWLFGYLRSLLAVAEEVRTAGFRYAQDIVWEKQNGSAFHADRFKRVHELIVQFYRSDASWKDVYNDVQTTPDATARTVRRKARPPHTGHIDHGFYLSEEGGPRLMRSVIFARNCHGRAIHPTEKPSALLEILIRTSCPAGGLVGDWFAGSGSAGEAALLAGRRYLGCEIDPAMAAMANGRIAATLPRCRSVAYLTPPSET